MRVALRKESVDRKIPTAFMSLSAWPSLSARRAWIEKPPGLACSAICTVALRKESVDRKGSFFALHPYNRRGSLSARRAWIEKPTSGTQRCWNWVALRKESVDRKIDSTVREEIGRASCRARV